MMADFLSFLWRLFFDKIGCVLDNYFYAILSRGDTTNYKVVTGFIEAYYLSTGERASFLDRENIFII